VRSAIQPLAPGTKHHYFIYFFDTSHAHTSVYFLIKPTTRMDLFIPQIILVDSQTSERPSKAILDDDAANIRKISIES
jgi:hypothetical protein